MRTWARASAVTALAALVLHAADARAGDCEVQPGFSTCVDADNLWPHAGAGPFFSIGSGATTPRGKLAASLVTTYLSRPIGLRIGSPDPEGTVVYLVDDAIDATLLPAWGVTDRLELALALPLRVFQDGVGLGEVLGTDEELPAVAMRDVRFGFALAALPPSPRLPSVVARLDFSMPTATTAAFAGSSGATIVPSVAGAYRIGRVGLGGELSARVRKEDELAGVRVASQAGLALGVSVDVIDRWLTAGIEGFGLYTFATQEPPGRETDATVGPALAPAEWILSATTAPLFDGRLSATLGGGGSLPLATEPAMTAPRFRASLAIRWVPGATAAPSRE
jgi:hypothetical protein